MNATRNPFYQLPGGADLPGDVRVNDTADATKTAADGWAASPAAVARVSTALSYLIYKANEENNSASFKYKSVGGLRSTFILISTSQSSGICLNSLVVHIDDGSNASTELGSNNLSISNIVVSKSGDIFTVDITYDRYDVWGELFVIPSRDVTFICQ
nr:MAG TPA: hypothetical protein [Caudoviricetes sp.]